MTFHSGIVARRPTGWKVRLCGAILLVLLAACVPVPVVAEPNTSEEPETVGWVPLEVLTRPIILREGIGKVHDPVTTASPDAQAYYDQGVALLHSFAWIDAARSFHHALRLDPKLAMAYVGLSRAYTSFDDKERAQSMVKKAQSLASGTTDRERRRIGVEEKRLESIGAEEAGEKREAYRKALDEALAVDLEDVELWLLRGQAEGGDAVGYGHNQASSIAFFEAALTRSPDHVGAHHYLIHALEGIGKIDLALQHGEAFAHLAPNVPHAHHMYGHDLRRTGHLAEAIERFKRAKELEEAAYKVDGMPPQLDWHRPHNLNLLATAYQHEGQLAQAEQVMREVNALPSANKSQEFFKKDWPEFLLARGRAAEALVAAQELSRSKWPIPRAVGHALAGSALLATGRQDEAGVELAAADNELQSLPKENKAAAMYVMTLRGELLLRSGRREQGEEVLKEVERRARAVPGPDAWTQALFRLEYLGGVARAANDWDLAEYTAKQMVDHDPYYGGTHYALALVAEHKDDARTAQQEYVAAEKYWANADQHLPELASLRERRIWR